MGACSAAMEMIYQDLVQEDHLIQEDIYVHAEENEWDMLDAWENQHDEDQFEAWHRATADLPAPSVSPAGPPLPWWTPAHDTSPSKPVFAGSDLDGGPLYVGRAWHEGQLLPAKVAPEHQGAFVAWNGREHSKFFLQFEVLQLLRGRAEWIEASDGVIPAHAFPIGITTSGRAAYSARAAVQGIVTPGRIVEGDSCCYVPYGHKEWSFRNYEVLAIM